MKKAIKIIGVIAVIGLIIAAIVASITAKPSNAEKIWDQDMTVGNIEAKNYFIIYSDLICPYCIAFEDAIVENEGEFQQYIKDHDIVVEVRLSDFLYEYGEAHAEHSRHSAIAAYCAKNEGRFWDYYNLAVASVWNDYFKGTGKGGFTALNANSADYWSEIGHKIGLGESFDTCVKTKAPLEEIKENAAKSAKLISGMPYFKFNKFVSSGFGLDGNWEDVLQFFQAGLDS
jgi:hypothetical protein